MENSKYCEASLIWTLICLVAPMSCSFSSLNPLLVVLQNNYNESYTIRFDSPMTSGVWNLLLSLTVSLPLASALIGALSSKYLMDRFGRKRVIIISQIINILSNLIVAIAGGCTVFYEVIIIGRLLLGLSFGLSINLSTVIISELSIKKRQGFLQGLIAVAFPLGGIIGLLFGYRKTLGTYELWPTVITIDAVLPLMWLITSPWMVESPIYLLQKGETEKAENILARLRKGERGIIKQELKEIIEEQNQTIYNNNNHGRDSCAVSESGVSLRNQTLTFREIIKSRPQRRILVAVLLIYANLMLSGINNMIFFSDNILLTIGVNEEYVTLATIGTYVPQLVVSFIGSRIVSKVGGRKLSICSNIIIIFALSLLTLSQSMKDKLYGMEYVAIASLLIFVIAWSGGSNVATFALVSEITSESNRLTCVKLGSSVFWITSWFVGFIPPYFQDWFGPYNMVPWIITTFGLAMYKLFILPETKGLNPKEIQDIFSK